jgi:hypothetical protein
VIPQTYKSKEPFVSLGTISVCLFALFLESTSFNLGTLDSDRDGTKTSGQTKNFVIELTNSLESTF